MHRKTESSPNFRHDFRGFRRRVPSQFLANFRASKLLPQGKILVIAAHPDDETFGTGGLLLTARNSIALSRPQSPKPAVIFLTSGDHAHQGCCDISSTELGLKREGTARRVTAALGVDATDVHFMRAPDGRLPRSSQTDFESISDRLAALIREINPDQIYTHHPEDGHPDHLAVEELTRAALRKAQLDVSLFHYCVWYWLNVPFFKSLSLDWGHAAVLDIRPVHGEKKAAIQAYLDDLAPCGNPYCGILPSAFVRAFDWKKELFFAVPKARW